MDLGISGRVALVIGASRGMGLAIAEDFAREGCKVVIAARRQGPLDAAVARLRALGAEAAGIGADCTTEEGLAAANAAAKAAFGPPDIAVFNVEMGRFMDFDHATPEDFLMGHQALVMAFAALVREVAPDMKARRWGRILTIGSIAARQPHRDIPLVVDNVYRAAAVALSKTLSVDLGPFGITVNTVGPGSVGTQMHEESFREHAARSGKSYEEVAGALLARIPLRRFGTAQEFSGVCVLLCSERGGFITGQTLLVDGGRMQSLH